VITTTEEIDERAEMAQKRPEATEAPVRYAYQR